MYLKIFPGDTENDSTNGGTSMQNSFIASAIGDHRTYANEASRKEEEECRLIKEKKFEFCLT